MTETYEQGGDHDGVPGKEWWEREKLCPNTVALSYLLSIEPSKNGRGAQRSEEDLQKARHGCFCVLNGGEKVSGGVFGEVEFQNSISLVGEHVFTSSK